MSCSCGWQLQRVQMKYQRRSLFRGSRSVHLWLLGVSQCEAATATNNLVTTRLLISLSLSFLSTELKSESSQVENPMCLDASTIQQLQTGPSFIPHPFLQECIRQRSLLSLLSTNGAVFSRAERKQTSRIPELCKKAHGSAHPPTGTVPTPTEIHI